MTATTSPDIQLLPAGASGDTELMRQIAALVNRVYAIAEAGLWRPGATRTTVEEITRLAGAGELVVARHGSTVVGSIKVRQVSDELAETGMLVADPDRRGEGIGRALRRFVTDLLRRRGITTVRIELLAPRDWEQPSKRFMAEWNERAGYRVIRQGAFEDQYPDLAPLLATPCDFVVYHLTLRP
jgi:GNAT superfamily N-acetyltransferase